MDLVEVKNRKTDIARHPWELARLEIVNSLLKQTIKNDEAFTILDVGCGDIFFISKLSEYYPKVSFYAIDIAFTDEIIQSLSANIGDKKIYLFKSLDDASKHLKKQANLVLLLDVVEHIENDISFLKDLHAHAAISNETTFMITVPAYQSLFCSHDYFLGHFRRYTNKTLQKTIIDSGFETLEVGYFFFSLILPRIIQVIKEKITKPNLASGTTGLVEWNGGNGITALIKSILLLDYKTSKLFKTIFGKSLPGLSNYMICKKRE